MDFKDAVPGAQLGIFKVWEPIQENGLTLMKIRLWNNGFQIHKQKSTG